MAFEGLDFGILTRGVPQIDVAGSMGKGLQLRDMMQARKDDDAMRELSRQAGGDLGQLADLAQQKGLYRQAQGIRKQKIDFDADVAKTKEALARTDKLTREAVQAGNDEAAAFATWAFHENAAGRLTPEAWTSGLQEVAKAHPVMAGALQQFPQFSESAIRKMLYKASTTKTALSTFMPKVEERSGALVPVTTDILGQQTVGAPVGFKAQDAGTKIQQDRANELANAKTDAEREAINRFYDTRIRKINEPGMAAMVIAGNGGGNARPDAPLPDPGMEAIAQAIARGDQPPQDYSVRNPAGKLINARAAIIAGGDLIGKTGVEERKAGKMEFSPKGTAGKSLIALDTATGHLAHLQDLGTALQNGDVQAINRVSNYFQTQTGVPGANNFELVKNFVIPEIIKTAKGAGQITEGEEKQLSKLIGDMSSPEQIQGFVSQASHIMGSKIQALNPVYQRYFGQEASVGDRLRPETRQLLQGIGVDLGGGKPPDKGKAPEIKFKDWWQPKPRGGEPDMSTRGKNPRFPQRNVAWVGAGAPDGAGWYAALGDGTVRRVE